MKTLKLNTQILIIFWTLIAFGASILKTYIGSDGRDYLVEYEEKYNWFQAWHECARRNRQLLAIDSAEKQNVIYDLFKGKGMNNLLWLGANDEFDHSFNADRPFFWSATGKQFTYANWYHRNSDPYTHCVLLYLGFMQWTNSNCDRKRGFICEEKQLLESFNKNPNNTSDDALQKITNDFDLKFLSILKDNMVEVNVKLENIKQMTNSTQTAVQKILNKQEISTEELNHEITKQGKDLSDQLKRTADELNAKFNEKQNFTYHPKNIVLIKNTG